MLMSTSTQKYCRTEVRLSALILLGVTELYHRVQTLMLVLMAGNSVFHFLVC
jgi:hypothetical protein